MGPGRIVRYGVTWRSLYQHPRATKVKSEMGMNRGVSESTVEAKWVTGQRGSIHEERFSVSQLPVRKQKPHK
jgi:hypothetical protein